MFLFGPPNPAKLYEKRDVKGLIKLLSDHKNVEVRQKAAEFLGMLHDPSAIEPLIAATKDPNSIVKGTAFGTLAEFIDHPHIFNLFCEVLRGEDRSLYTHAAWGLSKCGEKAIAPLVEFLNSGKARGTTAPQAVVNILNTLGWQGDKSEAGAYYWISLQKVEKCVEIGAPALPALFRYIDGHPNDQCEPAMLAVAQIKDPLSIKYLTEKMNNEKYRPFCVKALGEYGSPEADQILISMYKKGVKYAINPLLKIGSPGIECLISQLSDIGDGIVDFYKDPWSDVIKAMEHLGRVGDKRAAQPVLHAMLMANKHTWHQFEFHFSNLFEGYTSCIQDAVQGYEVSEETEFTPYGTSGDCLRTYTFDLQPMIAAVKFLLACQTPVAINILHMISERKDPIVMKQKGYYAGRGGLIEEPLSLSAQRNAAKSALDQLGNPAFDPSAFLVEGAWSLVTN